MWLNSVADLEAARKQLSSPFRSLFDHGRHRRLFSAGFEGSSHFVVGRAIDHIRKKARGGAAGSCETSLEGKRF
jgi:hypothetical protein